MIDKKPNNKKREHKCEWRDYTEVRDEICDKNCGNEPDDKKVCPLFNKLLFCNPLRQTLPIIIPRSVNKPQYPDCNNDDEPVRKAGSPCAEYPVERRKDCCNLWRGGGRST